MVDLLRKVQIWCSICMRPYGSLVWSLTTHKNLDSIFILQKKVSES